MKKFNTLSLIEQTNINNNIFNNITNGTENGVINKANYVNYIKNIIIPAEYTDDNIKNQLNTIASNFYDTEIINDIKSADDPRINIISREFHDDNFELYNYSNNYYEEPYSYNAGNIILCGMSNPFKHDDNKLNVGQKIYDLFKKFNNIILLNNKNVYITLETLDQALPENKSIEKTLFKNMCKKCNCKFYDITIDDYMAPTENDLYKLWEILDKYQFDDTAKSSIILHCEVGSGRTGTMIMSYIWLNLYRHAPNNNMVNFTEFNEIRDILNDNNISSNDKNINDNYEIIEAFKCINKNDFILNLKVDILNKYRRISYGEIFKHDSLRLLLLRRIYRISEAIKKFVNKPLTKIITVIDNNILIIDNEKIKPKSDVENYFIKFNSSGNNYCNNANILCNEINVDIDMGTTWISEDNLKKLYTILDDNQREDGDKIIYWDAAINKYYISILISYIILKIIRKKYEDNTCKTFKDELQNLINTLDSLTWSDFNNDKFIINLTQELKKYDKQLQDFFKEPEFNFIKIILKTSYNVIFDYIDDTINIKYKSKYLKYKSKYLNLSSKNKLLFIDNK